MNKEVVKAAIEQLREDAVSFVSEQSGTEVDAALHTINESIYILNDELGLDLKSSTL